MCKRKPPQIRKLQKNATNKVKTHCKDEEVILERVREVKLLTCVKMLPQVSVTNLA